MMEEFPRWMHQKKMQHTLIIFDTEFTAWQGSQERNWSEPWEFREVIQIAAVKVKVGENGIEVLGSFNELLTPIRNPLLSEYIVDLTGISQEMVDEFGIDFTSALKQFHDFCERGQITCFAWGSDPAVLEENCFLNDINMPEFSAGFVDLRQLAKKLELSGANLSSGELSNHLKMDVSGHQHNALHDVRSMAAALDKWIASGQLPMNSLFNPIS